MSIERPYGDTPDKGVLMVGAELLPMSSPEYEIGPPQIKAIEIARVTDRGLREAGALDVKKMCIEVGEKVWFVAVDVCSISDCGNLQDVASIATIAALKDAVFPSITDLGKVDYKNKTKEKLPLVKMPLAVTVHKIGDHLVVDPSAKEESASDARLTITVEEKGNITALQKGGDMPLMADDVNAMTKLAVENAKKLRKALK